MGLHGRPKIAVDDEIAVDQGERPAPLEMGLRLLQATRRAEDRLLFGIVDLQPIRATGRHGLSDRAGEVVKIDHRLAHTMMVQVVEGPQYERPIEEGDRWLGAARGEGAESLT